ncbi:MAG: pentapeptide repeat-containing protein [Anaerolineae bacterium]|nr:pentapeptide repeat-containing protein [Anaerolineae bacterium]
MDKTQEPSPQLDLSPYLNRWIALVRGRVVGVGLTAEQAERAAKRVRPKEKARVVFVDGEGRINKEEESNSDKSMGRRLIREELEQIVESARKKGERPDFREMDLSGLDLRGMNLHLSEFIGPNLAGAILSKTNLSKMNLSRADLSRSNLREAILEEVNLGGANLSGADLTGANLNNAYMVLANFDEANLNGAGLRGVNLNRAFLSKANLSETKLIKANLSEAELNGTILSGAIIEYNIFGNVDLREVLGLDTIKHIGPSYIDIHTLYNSVGNVSCDTFFIEAGVPAYLVNRIKETKNPVRCLYTSDEIAKEISISKELVAKYKKNIAIVEERIANKGIDRGVMDINERDEYNKMVERFETMIIEFRQHREYNCPVCTAKRQ